MVIYDLTQPLESGMPVYPGTEPASVEPTASVAADGYRTTRLDLDSHTGTHVDAPAHMSPGPSLSALPLETFHLTATVADCRPLEAREVISAGRLERAVEEAVSGVDERTLDLVVVRTGWETHWGEATYYDHPYLSADAADWLVERDLHLGLDALNPDPTPTANAGADEPAGFPVHDRLFATERVILENLCGLEAVTDDERFTLSAFPLAIPSGDGSPVRAVAILE
ncbi:cyclase family protein [Natronobiforma cellulositropha]|uniref:cyclase family protein n=1 Tax=Natronobiforma cellulositropha TaxID=1679076 RepID=UPI00294FF934|nr:cyclase family protein [Natronobiforma cellulositropha]